MIYNYVYAWENQSNNPKSLDLVHPATNIFQYLHNYLMLIIHSNLDPLLFGTKSSVSFIPFFRGQMSNRGKQGGKFTTGPMANLETCGDYILF